MVKDYMKKQVTIQAMEWTGENVEELEDFTEDQDNEKWFREFDEYGEQHLYIFTLEGSMKANIGDYIIKGVKGEFYPCKPDIFEMTYEDISIKEVAPDNDDWKSNRNFSDALRFLKLGEKMSRSGWNGKGMYVFYRKGIENVPISNEITANELGKAIGETMTIKPHFWIKNVDGTYSNWVPSINDLLSEDWEIVEL